MSENETQTANRLEFSPLNAVGLLESANRWRDLAGVAMTFAARYEDAGKPAEWVREDVLIAMNRARTANALADAYRARHDAERSE